MAYDEKVADRVRHVLSGRSDVVETKMMGALTFMVGGHMCCGVTGTALMVRVGPEAYDAALAEPHVRPMEIGGGRRPRALVCVDPKGYATDESLLQWVGRGLEFVSTLPAKTAAG